MFENEGEMHGGGMDPFDGWSAAVRGFYEFDGELHCGSRAKERSGVRFLTIALVTGTALLVSGSGSLFGLTVRRQFFGPPMRDREALHAAPQQRPSERGQP
jgi:hypothetical protein